MLSKFIVGSLFASALLVGGVFAADKQTEDCCKAKMACCAKKSTCCIADKKAGCCEKGQKCCVENRACCGANPPACCVKGSPCCDEPKACCGKATKHEGHVTACCAVKPTSKAGCCSMAK